MVFSNSMHVAVVGLFFVAVSAVGAENLLDQQGNSSAQVEGLPNNSFRTTIANTTFIFDDGLISVLGDKSQNVGNPVSRGFLFRIAQKTTKVTGTEKGSSTIDIEARNPKSNTVLWKISDKADRYALHSEYFLMSTISDGCCGSMDSFRAFSELTGDFLFPYSFTAKSNLPIVLRADAFDPRMIRYLAYQDNHWPTRDKSSFSDPDGKLTLAGILSYANTTQTIQKIAIFFDQKANDRDPSSNPDRIEVLFGNKKWVFRHSDAPQDYDVSYWNRDAKEPTAIFSGLTVNLVWETETISIPIENDQIDVSKIKAGQKVYKKVVPLPTQHWPINK